MFTAVVSQLISHEFASCLGSFCVEFVYSSGYSGFLPKTKNMQSRVIDNSKLSLENSLSPSGPAMICSVQGKQT